MVILFGDVRLLSMVPNYQQNSTNTFNTHRGENTMSNNFKLEIPNVWKTKRRSAEPKFAL
jgi:hypothetical protein